jgi:osmotically-inducible protein OsmY
MVLAVGWLFLSTAAVSAVAAEKVTDQAVADAVSDELFSDFAVTGETIDVFVADGVVTLTGTANNLLAKERATRIASAVKGVVSVVNSITVVPPITRSDAQIRDDVKTALLTDPATDSYEATVSVENGHVTLSGEVDSLAERMLTERVAKGVRGVTAVTNNIAVDYRQQRPDKEIRTDIVQRLKWNALIDHVLIDVAVNNGGVDLAGTVGSAAEKNRAIVDAWVSGVEMVSADALDVARWARNEDLGGDKYAEKADAEVRDAVRNALLFDPRVGFYNVDVSVNEGVVTLRGSVEDLKAKRAAARDARNTVGVLRVKNRLRVKPAEPISGEKTAERVENALLLDPYVNRYDIRVEVENGIARLYGTVDSYFDKAQADDVAARVDGVVAVDNNLVVNEAYDPYAYDPYVDDWYVYDYDWYDYQPGYTFKSDAEIADDIRSEFFWSPFVDGGDITVEVEDGAATLTGHVDSWSEYASATENAREGGATWVENELTVR